MAAAERGTGPAIEQRLEKEFYRFTFFQAADIVQALCADKKPLGEALRPADEAVRFKVRPGFVFPPSDISGLTFAGEEPRVTMEVAFLGLIGPSGILPRWYNELALERVQNKDHALTDFFDLFHHRLNVLFYLAWKKSALTVNYRRGAGDRYSRYFKCFIGLGTTRERSLAGLDHEALLHFAGLLARQVPSTTAIASVMTYYSGQKAAVQQFIERAIAVAPEDQTRIGMANATLGRDALCGSRVADCMSKFRINLGPMDSSTFVSFLPGGAMLRSMFALVRFMVGIEYEFDIRLILKRDQVAPCSLGGVGSAFAPLLGCSTWLKAAGTVFAEDPAVTFQYPDVVVA